MKRILTLITVLSALASVASADQLITNGGFETGDFTGWVTGATGGSIGVDTVHHTGQYSAFMNIQNNDGDSGFMQQAITLTQVSNISSFDVWIDTPGGATVTLNIEDDKGGLFEYDQYFKTNSDRPWIEWNLLPVITAGSSTPSQIGSIEFEVNGMNGGNNNEVHFDDASLIAGATPEPSSYAALAMGSFGIILLRRRKK